MSRTSLSATTPIVNDTIEGDSENKSKYKSPWSTTKLSIGPSVASFKGPNEDLLL